MIKFFLKKKLFIFHILMCLLLCSCYTKSIEKYISIAEENKLRGNYKKAKRTYSKLIKKQSNNADFYIARAECRYISSASSKKSRLQVHADYNKALSIKPWYTNALKSRARFYYFLGIDDYKYSIRDIDDVIKRDGDYTEGYFLKSKIYLNYKDSSNAYYNFNKALDLTEKTNDKQQILIEFAIEEYYNKDYNSCIKTLLKLKSLDNSSNSNELLSRSYWQINKKDSACFYLKNSNAKAPYNSLTKIIANFCQ